MQNKMVVKNSGGPRSGAESFNTKIEITQMIKKTKQNMAAFTGSESPTSHRKGAKSLLGE